MKVRISFIEDDPVFTKAILEYLHLQTFIKVISTYFSVEDFFAAELKPKSLDILFLDVDLPGKSGIAALSEIKNLYPKAQVIMLTMSDDQDLLLRAFHLGADGYLNKNFQLSSFPGFVKTIMAGGAVISPNMAKKMISHFKPQGSTFKKHPVTQKEHQILQLFSEGKSYNEVATIIGISVNGVRYHVKAIYNKMGVNSKIDAIRLFQNGFPTLLENMD